MKFRPKLFKEIICEYSMKGAELKSNGQNMNDPELARVIDIIIWAGQAYRNMQPPKNKEAAEKQIKDLEIAVIELNKLGVFAKYLDK